MNEPTRQPHAVLDADSRLVKAQKMERIIGTDRIANARSLLEVGTGSGRIAAYFARQHPQLAVHATDVVDSRVVSEGYDFTPVNDVNLPFADQAFDLVISNHVMEHVGERPAQLQHLREIHRVLRDDGLVYFAIPNRWGLWEGHFRLPLLSWLPRSMADRYVRMARRGTHYDCTPRSHGQLLALMHEAGFGSDDLTLDALGMMFELEAPRRPALRALRPVALPLARLGFPLIPTYVFVLKKART